MQYLIIRVQRLGFLLLIQANERLNVNPLQITKYLGRLQIGDDRICF